MDNRRQHGGTARHTQHPTGHHGQQVAADAWLSSTGEFFLANYELGRKIGNGSFGVVCGGGDCQQHNEQHTHHQHYLYQHHYHHRHHQVRLALHKLTGHHVAVKIISKKKLQEKDPNSEDKRML